MIHGKALLMVRCRPNAGHYNSEEIVSELCVYIYNYLFSVVTARWEQVHCAT